MFQVLPEFRRVGTFPVPERDRAAGSGAAGSGAAGSGAWVPLQAPCVRPGPPVQLSSAIEVKHPRLLSPTEEQLRAQRINVGAV